MTAKQFAKQYEADAIMSRKVAVLIVETTDGYLLARAEGYCVAYCASRTTSKAAGRAASAAAFGEYADAEAFETPEAALTYARNSAPDYH